MRQAYLDHSATAPIRPEVIEAVSGALGATGNPSSVHRWGRGARRRVERAREQVAGLVRSAPESVVFTSGGTEANNLALQGFGRPVLASAVEHESILGFRGRIRTVPVDRSGVIDLNALEAALQAAGAPATVAIMLANNETGVVQPVRAVAEIARRYGAAVHCDGVQAAGKIEVDFDALGVDSLALSAHKLGGPQGVGALVARAPESLAPVAFGGGQERGRRAGTENVAGIVGFGVAAEIAARDLRLMVDVGRLRDDMEKRVRGVLAEAPIYGADVRRLPTTSCIGMPGVKAETQVMAFDLEGVAVSAGSACSSGKVRRSHVLGAMGVAPEAAECAIRVSFGWSSTAADADRLVEVWTALWTRLGASRGLAPAA